jgi:transcriptional regulator with XRE-family HTH domain
MLALPAPKTAYHPLEVLTRKGASQDEIAERLGLTVQEVAKVRRRLRLLNWVIVGAAYELVR